jgi:hypothetical protein
MSNEAWSDTAQGTRITFSTTANTTTTTTEKMRIDDAGNVGIGTSSPSSFAKLAVIQTTGSNAIQIATAGNTSGMYMTPSDGGQFSLNSYAIINDVITQRDEKTQKLVDSINSLPQTIQATVLAKMTDAEIRSLIGLETKETTVTTQTPLQ